LTDATEPTYFSIIHCHNSWLLTILLFSKLSYSIC